MSKQRCFSGFLACGLMAAACVATVAAAPADTDAVVLDSVTVTGAQPGPGLWRVSNGEHHLWLVGTLTPVPHNLDWRPAELEERLAEAHALLRSPGVKVGTGRGLLHALSLAPSAVGLRKNPGRQTLADVVPAELYGRWLELKSRYLGNNRRVERWRPLFAAQRLHEAAVEGNAMSLSSPVQALLKDTASTRNLPTLDAVLEITIDDPRRVLRDFKSAEVEDMACFEATLQRLESDIGLLRGRANAWATGDLDTLRMLSGADPASACINALLGIPALAGHGFDDLETRVHAAWLAAADQALDEYPVSVGALPMSELLRPGGLLAQLGERGYTVLAPDELDHDLDDDELAEPDDITTELLEASAP